MATMAGVPAEPGSRHACGRGGLSEGAVRQRCVVEAPALPIMEQLFGARCARALELRVNRGEEQCKQRWDGGSCFPAAVNGGKQPQITRRRGCRHRNAQTPRHGGRGKQGGRMEE